MIINGHEITDGILDLRDSGITVLENKAFLSGKLIREVYLPSGVTHIGNWAFAKCSNLRRVTFADDFRPGIFGKEVFGGCDELRSIEFADSDPETSTLLAMCTNKLAYDHLLRSDDVGLKSWFEKWDISLVSKLKSDDAEARMSAALCGEEDISYDGIGSVDGEMPGETEDYVRREEFAKCELCYIRLTNDRFLGKRIRQAIEDFLTENRFGFRSGAAFYSVFDAGEKALAYLQTYLDVIKPDAGTLKEMIDAVPKKDVYARSFLIGKSSEGCGGLDSLML